MKRDLTTITRDLESRKNNDIIFKKDIILHTLQQDPDLQEVLGVKTKLPNNSFVDPEHPTQEELAERKRIQEYNEKIQHTQILPYLKLNGIQKEVLNFIMFEVEDIEPLYANKKIKTQKLTVLCLVHEDDMDTEYEILRTDLLSYIVKDLLNMSNIGGNQMVLSKDRYDIIDAKYYCRTLNFISEVPLLHHIGGSNNPYDNIP